MSDYFIADLVPSDEGGYGPDLPEGTSYGLIAEPGREAKWALYVTNDALDDLPSHGIDEVPPDLRNVLHSAEMYPPAMALARNDIERYFRDKTPTRDEFLHRYAEVLRSHLRAQPNHSFMLCEAVKDEGVYISVGEFLWVLQYLPDTEEVRWISGDYFVYKSPAFHFRLNDEQKRILAAPCGHDDCD